MMQFAPSIQDLLDSLVREQVERVDEIVVLDSFGNVLGTSRKGKAWKSTQKLHFTTTREGWAYEVEYRDHDWLVFRRPWWDFKNLPCPPDMMWGEFLASGTVIAVAREDITFGDRHFLIDHTKLREVKVKA